ncbi:hypothetical protein M406DRAFT_39037, partial [Cryphonectria parasitica EP155]
YDIVNITWALEAEPYIPKHNYIGTIQEVVGHINDNYPNYTWPDVDLTYLSGNTMDTSVAELSEPSERGIVHCWRFNMTTTSAAWEGIAYLNSIPGKPSNGPGPGACGRVSCADDAGIWWCNDVSNKPALRLSSCLLQHLKSRAELISALFSISRTPTPP